MTSIIKQFYVANSITNSYTRPTKHFYVNHLLNAGDPVPDGGAAVPGEVAAAAAGGSWTLADRAAHSTAARRLSRRAR